MARDSSTLSPINPLGFAFTSPYARSCRGTCRSSG